MESLSRRRFIGELTTIGAGALVSGAAFAMQRGPARAGKINIHACRAVPQRLSPAETMPESNTKFVPY